MSPMLPRVLRPHRLLRLRRNLPSSRPPPLQDQLSDSEINCLLRGAFRLNQAPDDDPTFGYVSAGRLKQLLLPIPDPCVESPEATLSEDSLRIILAASDRFVPTTVTGRLTGLIDRDAVALEVARSALGTSTGWSSNCLPATVRSSLYSEPTGSRGWWMPSPHTRLRATGARTLNLQIIHRGHIGSGCAVQLARPLLLPRPEGNDLETLRTAVELSRTDEYGRPPRDALCKNVANHSDENDDG